MSDIFSKLDRQTLELLDAGAFRLYKHKEKDLFLMDSDDYLGVIMNGDGVVLYEVSDETDTSEFWRHYMPDRIDYSLLPAKISEEELFQEVTAKMANITQSELSLTEEQLAEVVDDTLANLGYESTVVLTPEDAKVVYESKDKEPTEQLKRDYADYKHMLHYEPPTQEEIAEVLDPLLKNPPW